MNLSIEGVSDSIACLEAVGLSKCFAAYADHCAGEYIMGVGFNPNSGYTYIATEIGICICSMLGRDVEYLVTNIETGEESFFDSFEEAQTFFDNMPNYN